MSFWDDLEDTVSDGADAVVGAAEDAADAVVGAAEDAAQAAADAAQAAADALAQAAEAALEAAEKAAEKAEHAAEAVVHAVANGIQDTVKLGISEVETVAKGLGHAAVDLGTTLAHDASDAVTTIVHGTSDLGDEAIKTVEGIAHAAGDGASAFGEGFINTWKDIGGTVGKIGGDIIHTGEKLGGDVIDGAEHLVTGDFGGALGDVRKFGGDLADGAEKTVVDVAQGAIDVAKDAAHTVVGVGQALVEGGSAAFSGALEMAGTVAGTAGELAKDYEDAMGAIVKGGVDAVVTIADAETNFVTGTIAIGAHAVGTPLGDFYANVAEGYGEAITGTLNHVGGAIDDGAGKLTKAAGDLTNAAGHGADQLGHDGGAVIDDIARGDLDAAAHDAGQFGKDAFEAGKGIAAAQLEGAEALASAASDVGTVLNGLNEAMGKAAGAFVSAVGETVGGDAGHVLEDLGQKLGGATEVASDLVQGNFEAAGKAGAKELGGEFGKWVGDHIRDAGNSLGDKVGGVFGDGIKAAGDKAADATEGAAKDLAGTAFDKGLDVVKGGGDASKSDGHDDSSNQHSNSDNDESLFDKAWHAAENAANQAVDKAVDAFNNAVQHPESLLNQGADALKDHFGKGATDTLGKLFGVGDASHSSGGSSHADGATTGTTHSALTGETSDHADDLGSALSAGDPAPTNPADAIAADQSAFWDMAAKTTSLGSETLTTKSGDLLHEIVRDGTTASAVETAHIPALESQLPSFGGDGSAGPVLSDHASWAALNPQPLPPGPDGAIASSALQGHASDAGIIIVGGHDADTSAATALHDSLSWAALNPQPLPPMPGVDHAVLTSQLAHLDVPAFSASEFAHQLHI